MDDAPAGETVDSTTLRPTPATVEFTLLPDDTATVPWTEHMRWLFTRLDRALGPLELVPLDADLTTKISERSIRLPRVESWVYKSPYARRIRFTYVDEGEEKQIFNAVVYPEPVDWNNEGLNDGMDALNDESREKSKNKRTTHLGDCPLLGVDLLCLGKGKNILVGLDLQPLSEESAYVDRYVSDLQTVRDKFADLNITQPSSRFYDDAQFFSSAMLFCRPDPPAMAAMAAMTAAAAAGVESIPGQFADDVCDAEGASCGAGLVRERTLDAVKAYTDLFLELLNVQRDGDLIDDESSSPDLVSNVVALEENQNIYDRNGLENSRTKAVQASVWDAIYAIENELIATLPQDFGSEMTEQVARVDGKSAVAEAQERLGVEEVRAGKVFGDRARYAPKRILSVLETATQHDGHDAWQKSRDPALLLFESWFGKAWGEKMANDVLFPTGAAVAELEARGKVTD